uniref:C2H2-type domain-containing protein n=1 Tax=Steinernema glaseri TaxID=37863 RepID=A0A1I8AJM0_9BILA
MRRCFPQQLVNSDHECNKCGKNCSTSDQRHKHIHTAHAVVKLIRCPVGGCTTERTKPTDLRNHIDTVHQTMTRPEEEAFARLSTDYYESLRTEMNTCFPLPLPKKNTPKAPTTFNAYGGVRVLANMMGGIVGKIYTEQKSKKIVFESSDSEDEGPPTEFKKSPPPSEVDPSENRDHTPQRGQEALNRSNRQPTRGGRTYQPSPPSSSFGAQNSGYRGHSGGRGGYGGRGGWRRGSPRGRGGPSSPYRGGH